MKRIPIILPLLLLPALAAAPALAQSSTHYRLEQSVFNAAGHLSQGVTLGSASYKISLDSLAEDVVSVNLASGSYQWTRGGPRPTGHRAWSRGCASFPRTRWSGTPPPAPRSTTCTGTS